MKLVVLITINCLFLLISIRKNAVDSFDVWESAQNRELKIDLYEIAPNKTVYVIDKLNKFSFEKNGKKKSSFKSFLINYLFCFYFKRRINRKDRRKRFRENVFAAKYKYKAN